ncbi:MAG: polyprenyl synthetase family protein [Specibacter sp.]
MTIIKESQTASQGETRLGPRAKFTTTRPSAHEGAPEEWSVFQDRVRDLLDQYFAAERRRAAGYSPAFGVLWENMAGTTTGGKWMRPRLVHLSYQAFGGRDAQACSELAAAFEMLHAALLVHDDVIDRDFVRRGSDTLGAVYRDVATAQGRTPTDADHAGFSAAIIAGDLLLTASLRLAASASAGHPHGAAILATIHEAIFSAAAGELEDLLLSLRTTAPDLPEVLNMERMKTAVYSFEMPLRAGALLAGESVATADALAAVGRDIGVAYQVIDDVLGTFGVAAMTGKSVESDLREGKSTILTTFAAGSDDFAATLEAFRDGDADAASVRTALRQAGAQAQALGLAETLVAQALEKAAELALPEPLTLQLRQICDHVLSRRN